MLAEEFRLSFGAEHVKDPAYRDVFVFDSVKEEFSEDLVTVGNQEPGGIGDAYINTELCDKIAKRIIHCLKAGMGSNQSKPVRERVNKEHQLSTNHPVKKLKTTSFIVDENTADEKNALCSKHSFRRRRNALHKFKRTVIVQDQNHDPEMNKTLQGDPETNGAHDLVCTNNDTDISEQLLEPVGEYTPNGVGFTSDSKSTAYYSAENKRLNSSESNISEVSSFTSTDTCTIIVTDCKTQDQHIADTAVRNPKYPENKDKDGASDGQSMSTDGGPLTKPTTSLIHEQNAIGETTTENFHVNGYPETTPRFSFAATCTFSSHSHLPSPVLSSGAASSASSTASSFSSNAVNTIDQPSVCTSFSSTNQTVTTSLSLHNTAILNETSSSLSSETSYGNFSMNTSDVATSSSPGALTGYSLINSRPSDSYFASSEPPNELATRSDSETVVSFSSSANGLSNVESNPPALYSFHESLNSNSRARLSHNTYNTNSNTSINYSYSRPNNLNNSENDIDTDSLDFLNDEALAQRLQEHYFRGLDLPPAAVERDRNNFDRNYITIRTSVGDTTTRISSKNITLSSHAGADLTDENMGIILERPKYPRYATLASREKSFENWPVTNKISWKKLPEAGFVYTGTADCVRCYYCNGGLREWLKNDCPWTEHARYYPHCPHVRQCKGDEFVRKVRNGADDGAVVEVDLSADEMEVDSEACGSILSHDQEAMKIAAEIISDQTLLEKAAFYIKNIQGKPSFNAQELAAIAFEIEEGTVVCEFEDGKENESDMVEEAETSVFSDCDDIEVDCDILEEENRLLRERSLCKVCLDATACVLFLDCGHMIACPMCAPALKTCAVCRAEVKGTVRAMYATDR